MRAGRGDVLKLLFYSPLSLRFGGGFEHWVLEVVTRLARFGVSTEILCTESTVGDRERVSAREIYSKLKQVDVEYSEIPYVRFPLGNSNSPIPSMRGLRKILNTKDYDVLYFPNAYAFQDILVAMLKIGHHKPVISGQHAVLFQGSKPHDWYVETVSRALLRGFDAHHVLNRQDLEILKRWGTTNVYLIPIGVDTTKFRPRTRGENHTEFKVLFVGRLTFQKGIDVLCESIKMINQESNLRKDVHFWIVGSGPLESLVVKIANQYSNVHRLALMSDEDIAGLYRSCDLLVMPSRRETFGIVALEAQASGLPVLAADIPGPRDILIDGITGKLIQPTDPYSLTSAIKEYYFLWNKDYEVFKTCCRRSRESAARRFDWEIIIKQIHEMIGDVCYCLER